MGNGEAISKIYIDAEDSYWTTNKGSNKEEFMGFLGFLIEWHNSRELLGRGSGREMVSSSITETLILDYRKQKRDRKLTHKTIGPEKTTWYKPKQKSCCRRAHNGFRYSERKNRFHLKFNEVTRGEKCPMHTDDVAA